jgi:hypothetical protein
MLTRTLVILTLLLTLTNGVEPKPLAAARAGHSPHERVIDDVEGCRVPPPGPVAVATCSDEGRP